MAAITDGGYPNIANIASRLDPDGMTAKIANVLSKKNPLLRDMPWMEGNLADGHRVARTTTSLPSATWRQANAGVSATKGEVSQFTESCGVLEDESKIDELLVEMNGGLAWRETEDAIKAEGLSQQLATSIFYESVSSNPERIHGLTARYPATTGYDASSYVKAGTNAGVNAHSIWLITWEPRKIYGIYPKGTKAGLERIDRGRERVLDGSSNPFYAYCTTHKWRCGIAVEDYRYAVRFQWDPDDAEMANNEKGLYVGMMDMLSVIYETTPNTRFYMNRTSLQKLNAQMISNEGRGLTWVTDGGKVLGDAANMGGERFAMFNGVPLRVADALVAETAIS